MKVSDESRVVGGSNNLTDEDAINCNSDYIKNIDSVAELECSNIVPFNSKFESDKPPLIKQGVYEAVYVKHSVARLHSNSGKVIVWFRIVSPGEHFNIVLPRYYNTQWIKQKSKQFKAGWKSDLMREFATFFEVPKRTDRIPISKFKDGIYKIKVRNVKKSRGRVIPESVQYSVVDSIVSRVD